MIEKTSKHNLFDLNASERKVLSFLTDSQRTSIESRVSNISKAIPLPRMTCMDAIRKLQKRGLLETRTLNGETHYALLNIDTILDSVRSIFSNSSDTLKVETSRTIDNQITIYSGLDNCHAVWRKIAQLGKGERFIFIQPNQSLTETFKKLGLDSLYPSNDALNDRGIITEGIVNESCFTLIYEILKKHKNKEFAVKELEKIAQRPSDVVLIDDLYLNLGTELLFMKDVAYLVNWQDQVTIEIRNPVIQNFIKGLYTLARGYGKKVNQHEAITNLLKKVSKEN